MSGPGALLGDARTPGREERPGLLVGALCSMPVVVVYLFVLVLMRVVPERLARRVRERPAAPITDGRGGSRLIALSVRLYRRSLLRAKLHRGGERCLFLPSCSEYAERAGRKHGLWRGLLLIGDRFRRCRADYRGDFVDFP